MIRKIRFKKKEIIHELRKRRDRDRDIDRDREGGERGEIDRERERINGLKGYNGNFRKKQRF
jgi:hypothetical protein